MRNPFLSKLPLLPHLAPCNMDLQTLRPCPTSHLCTIHTHALVYYLRCYYAGARPYGVRKGEPPLSSFCLRVVHADGVVSSLRRPFAGARPNLCQYLALVAIPLACRGAGRPGVSDVRYGGCSRSFVYIVLCAVMHIISFFLPL